MNVPSIALARSAPHDARDRDTASGVRRRIIDLLARLDRGSGGDGTPDDAVAQVTKRAVLLGFTAAEIIAGLALLVLATVTVPIGPAIASPALDGTALAGTTGGVLLWTMFGLLGSVRTVSSADGAGHFTFHLPFVGAAMILGGPTAGAWVAFLATTDRRELQSQPWYGVLANHASVAIAAIAGGVTYVLAREGLVAMTGDPALAAFVAVLLAGIVLEGVANGLAIMTVKVRDEMSWAGVLGIVVDDFRRETLIEVGLIWTLVIAFATVGWWASIVIGLAVVYLTTRKNDEIDDVTGFPRKNAFLEKVDRKVGWMRLGVVRGGTMLMFDINQFSLFNNGADYSVGDEIIRGVALRMKETFRREDDILSRLMGDEFAVFFVGLIDPEIALTKAAELIEAIARPIPTRAGTATITVSVGIVVATADGIATPSASALLDRVVIAEKLAKQEATGLPHVWSTADPTSVVYVAAHKGHGEPATATEE